MKDSRLLRFFELLVHSCHNYVRGSGLEDKEMGRSEAEDKGGPPARGQGGPGDHSDDEG